MDVNVMPHLLWPRLLTRLNHLHDERKRKKKQQLVETLEPGTPAALSAVLPHVEHLCRWRHGYESNFSSDLRIPCSIQRGPAWSEAWRCSPSQQKPVNHAPVYSLTQQGQGNLTLLLYDSVCLTFRVNTSSLLRQARARVVFFVRMMIHLAEKSCAYFRNLQAMPVCADWSAYGDPAPTICTTTFCISWAAGFDWTESTSFSLVYSCSSALIKDLTGFMFHDVFSNFLAVIFRCIGLVWTHVV